MHAWFAAAAKAINAKKYDTPALDALMTPAFRARLKLMLSSDIGLYYPGPVPSSPITVVDKEPGLRFIETCDVVDGYAQDPKTHKPAHPFHEVAGEVRMQQLNGKWVLQDWIAAPSRSCKGVHVPTPSW